MILFCIALKKKKTQYLDLKPISTSLQKKYEQEVMNHEKNTN